MDDAVGGDGGSGGGGDGGLKILVGAGGRKVSATGAAAGGAGSGGGGGNGGGSGGGKGKGKAGGKARSGGAAQSQPHASGVGGGGAVSNAAAANGGSSAAQGWYYRDPKGGVQGPWKHGDIAKWYRDGFYEADLAVRKGSNGAWTTLAEAMPSVVAPPGANDVAKIEVAPPRSRGGGDKQQQQQRGGADRGGKGGKKGKKGGKQPAGSGDIKLGGAIDLAKEADPSRGLVRTESHSSSGGGGKKGKKGKGGGDSANGTAQAAAEPADAVPNAAAAQALFGASKQWCYLDDSGLTQGPFDAIKMVQWHNAGYFVDKLKVAAMGSQDQGLDFKPLGDLLRAVAAGKQ